MNCEEIEQAVRQAFETHLKVEPFDIGCKVVLPQLDVNNDFLVFYVVESRRGIELTDLGRTLEALSAESLDLETEKRTEIFTSIIEQNGVRLRGDELVAEVPRDDTDRLREVLLLFTNAVQSVHAMLYLKTPRVTLDFRGLVRQYLFEKDIEHDYTARVDLPVVGPTSFDFVLQLQQRVAMDALHAMDVYYANGLIDRAHVKFEILGRLPSHPLRSLVFNDDSSVPEASHFPILSDVLDIPPIAWSEREERFDELVGSRATG